MRNDSRVGCWGILKPQVSEVEAVCLPLHGDTDRKDPDSQDASTSSTQSSMPLFCIKHELIPLCTWIGATFPAGAAV